MDIWNLYLHEKTINGKKKKEQININNKYKKIILIHMMKLEIMF